MIEDNGPKSARNSEDHAPACDGGDSTNPGAAHAPPGAPPDGVEARSPAWPLLILAGTGAAVMIVGVLAVLLLITHARPHRSITPAVYYPSSAAPSADSSPSTASGGCRPATDCGPGSLPRTQPNHIRDWKGRAR